MRKHFNAPLTVTAEFVNSFSSDHLPGIHSLMGAFMVVCGHDIINVKKGRPVNLFFGVYSLKWLTC